MSIELPEAYILGKQMNEGLVGKTIEKCELDNYERAQKVGFINSNIKDFEELVGGRIDQVISKGTMILISLNNGMALMLGPEYGGEFFLFEKGQKLPKKYQIRLYFNDGSILNGRLKGMGGIITYPQDELDRSYIYRREYSGAPSPLDKEFTYEKFKELTIDKTRQLKSVLVGKDAVLIGLMNSAFQDIIYRAKLHPKRRMSDLLESEREDLYKAIVDVVNQRIDLNGKHEFKDLHQQPGSYIPSMGPNMKEQVCSACSTVIEKLAHGGGHVYLCPSCQSEP